MVIAVKVISIIIAAFGILLVVKSTFLRQILTFGLEGKRIYAIAVLRFILGTFFLIAATQCRMPWLVIILGLLMLISGIFVFVLGIERSKAMVQKWQQLSDLTLRFVSLIPVAVGALLLYSA
ncbi:MAG: hypothetical protein ABIE74_09650 [Pseudomonadota bacterium]